MLVPLPSVVVETDWMVGRLGWDPSFPSLDYKAGRYSLALRALAPCFTVQTFLPAVPTP